MTGGSFTSNHTTAHKNQLFSEDGDQYDNFKDK